MSKKKRGLGEEFRTFILRGNVMDLAVGVIVGAAFQKIVTSLVNDIIMPIIGLVTGGVNFTDRFLILKLPEGVDAAMVTTLEEAKALGVTTFNYGAFITTVLDFLILAVVIFMMVKFLNGLNDRVARIKQKEEAEEEAKEE